jgi:hypothetical protein
VIVEDAPTPLTKNSQPQGYFSLYFPKRPTLRTVILLDIL